MLNPSQRKYGQPVLPRHDVCIRGYSARAITIWLGTLRCACVYGDLIRPAEVRLATKVMILRKFLRLSPFVRGVCFLGDEGLGTKGACDCKPWTYEMENVLHDEISKKPEEASSTVTSNWESTVLLGSIGQ